jgi:ribosomal protein S18 acetylase RimI-like enzyme
MISYRDATPADAAVLGGIARATFIETFGALYKLPDLEGFLAGRTDAVHADMLATPGCEVRFAEAGGSPVGYCRIGSLQLPGPGAQPGAVELHQLYVYRPWQGEGVAAALTEWALARARARGAPEIWLSVFTENPRARRFYARFGFVEIAPYAFMVGSQADEDIMCRKIL